jgi:hypothetical protein
MQLKKVIALVVGFVLVPTALLAQESADESEEQAAMPVAFVEITKPIFLFGADGARLLAGFYGVTLIDEDTLQITSYSGEAVVTEAYSVEHDQQEAVPAAVLVEGDGDRVDVVLVLADGQAHAAAGSYSGVTPRSGGEPLVTTRAITTVYKRLPTLYYECPSVYRFRGDLDQITRSYGGSTWKSDNSFYVDGRFRNMSTGSVNSAYLLMCNYEVHGYFSRVTRDPTGPNRDVYACTASNSTRRFTCTPR